MKKTVTIMLCLFSFILISCDKDEQEPEKFTVVDFSATNFPQEWKLVASRAAMIPNAKVTKVEGKAESYIFNEDFTFQKKSKKHNLFKKEMNDLIKNYENIFSTSNPWSFTTKIHQNLVASLY